MDVYSSLSLGDIDQTFHAGFKSLSLSDFQGFNPGKFLFLGQISQESFPVYKVTSLMNNHIYALKNFPTSIPEASVSFKNEIRFSYLKHPNIVKIEHFEVGQDLFLDTIHVKGDYFLTSYYQNGTFHDLIYEKEINLKEIIVRTYFHHLIDALEYLQSHGIAHMDIKLENLLVGNNFELKLCDFDTACYTTDGTHALGSQYFRAPEIITGTCDDLFAADIYSAAIVLFLLKTGGFFPHFEEEILEDETDLFNLLYNDPEKFWEVQMMMCGVEESFFDQDFKELFLMMIEIDPKKRAKISDLKKSKWFKKQILSTGELKKALVS